MPKALLNQRVNLLDVGGECVLYVVNPHIGRELLPHLETERISVEIRKCGREPPKHFVREMQEKLSRLAG